MYQEYNGFKSNSLGEIIVRRRDAVLGTKNLIGARVENKRKELGWKQKELLARLQINGLELNASALSKLEGQIRSVTDLELLIIAETLDVSLMWLLTGKE